MTDMSKPLKRIKSLKHRGKKVVPLPCPKGLYLWKARMNYHMSDEYWLWITTPTQNGELAAKKACACARAQGHAGVIIHNLTYAGTIDA